MQSENFDKKVREAAENHHPAYNEKAWDNMEKLLNRHLPEEKDNKRRFIFFLLLFLFLGGSAWVLIAKPWKGNREVAEANQTVVDKKPASGTTTANDPAKDQVTGNSGKDVNNEQIIPANTNNTGNTNNNNDKNVVAEKNRNTTTPKTAVTTSGPTGQSITKNNDGNTKISIETKQGTTRKKKPAAKQDLVNNTVPSQKPVVNKEQEKPVVDLSKNTRVDPVTNDKTNDKPVDKPTDKINSSVNNTEPAGKIADVKNDPAVKKNADKKESEPVVQTPAEKKAKEKSRKSNSFMVSLSAGPDVSFVGGGKAGRVKMVSGLGFGYTFKDRVTIRTGFYSARKIYSAKPSDYKAPPEFYQFYPYLQKVDANCRVYEIPLLLSYNFGKKSSRNWFVSAGLSTFLMNEETYNYFYKYTPTGNTYTNKWTIRNENKHFFSVGTFSAGYKQNFGKRVTFMAEPYIKVPFGGVGYGKVKLNSGGVLFTVGLKLF